MVEKSIFLMVLFTICLIAVEGEDAAIHSRQKRYVVFPEGSTFSIAWCMSLKPYTPDDNIYTMGVNWGVSYDLPNSSDSFNTDLVPAPAATRRHRRDLYRKVEVLLNKWPVDRVSLHEPAEHREYDLAKRKGQLPDVNCEDEFPSCPISLLDVFLRGSFEI